MPVSLVYGIYRALDKENTMLENNIYMLIYKSRRKTSMHDTIQVHKQNKNKENKTIQQQNVKQCVQ